MNWKEKMIKGMNLIREACFENDNDYEECTLTCPLKELCAYTKPKFHPINWDLLCKELKYNPIYLEDE